MTPELDYIELGPRPAHALTYVADVQVRMWRMGYDWRGIEPPIHITWLPPR